MTLEAVFNHIEESAKGSASEDDFAGLFDDIDVNSNKLGATVAKRNANLGEADGWYCRYEIRKLQRQYYRCIW